MIAALRRCLLQVPEVAASMRAAESVQSWQEFLTSLVTTAREITSLLLGALQSPGANEQGKQVPRGSSSGSHPHLHHSSLGPAVSSRGSPSHCSLLLLFAAAAPSFADMGNAIGSLITLGKGQQEEEEDSVLLSEEHSLILTCCWVSVKVGAPLRGSTHCTWQHSLHSLTQELGTSLPGGRQGKHCPYLGAAAAPQSKSSLLPACPYVAQLLSQR